jgi:hypothetical protein
MKHFLGSQGVVGGGLFVVFCLLPGMAFQEQQSPRASSANVPRPFADLSQLLTDVDNSYTALGNLKTKMQQDMDQLKADRAAFKQAQETLDRARNVVQDLKRRVEGTNKKWLCNAYGTLHNDPSECSKPGKGGVWVYIDRNGDSRRWTPPSQADLDTLKTVQRQLALLEQDQLDRKAQMSQREKAYKADTEKYNAQADELSKKVAGMADPKQALRNIRIAYEDAASRSGKQDPAIAQALDKMENLVGKVEGTGQCVALVQKFSGLGATATWKPGQTVKAGDLLVAAPAATFVKGVYPNQPSGNHAVVVLDKTDKGILVFDQYKGRSRRPPPQLPGGAGCRAEPGEVANRHRRGQCPGHEGTI